MGLICGERTVDIEAPVNTRFDAITDYENFPKWQSAVVDTEVLDWDEQGRGKRVRLFVDAKVRKVDYTLDYRYDEPGRLSAHPAVAELTERQIFDQLVAMSTPATAETGARQRVWNAAMDRVSRFL